MDNEHVGNIKDYDPRLLSRELILGKMYEMLSLYVDKEYSSKGKSIIPWKVFSLRLQGESFVHIAETLGIGYKSAMEYNSKCYIEVMRVFTNPLEYEKIFGKPLKSKWK